MKLFHVDYFNILIFFVVKLPFIVSFRNRNFVVKVRRFVWRIVWRIVRRRSDVDADATIRRMVIGRKRNGPSRTRNRVDSETEMFELL